MTDLDELWARGIREGWAEWRPGMYVGYTFHDMRHTTLWERLLDDCQTLADSALRLDEAAGAPYPGTPNPIRLEGADWADPATLGALLGLVRERVPGAWWGVRNAGWGVYAPNRGRIGDGPTEGHALLAALEATSERMPR